MSFLFVVVDTYISIDDGNVLFLDNDNELIVVKLHFVMLSLASDINVEMEWNELEMNYPIADRSIGVEIYNNTVYGFGGFLSDQFVTYYANIDDLLNINGASELLDDDDIWNNYTWYYDYSAYNISIGITYQFPTRTSVIGASTRINNLINLSGLEVGSRFLLIYDLIENEQVPLNTYNFLLPVQNGAACSINNGSHVFTIGGARVGNIVQVYDTINDKWTLAPPIHIIS